MERRPPSLSARETFELLLLTLMPSSLLGAEQIGSTNRGTLLVVSQRRKPRKRQSHAHLKGKVMFNTGENFVEDCST